MGNKIGLIGLDFESSSAIKNFEENTTGFEFIEYFFSRDLVDELGFGGVDIVLIDDAQNGIEIISGIRARIKNEDLPIIVLTKDKSHEDILSLLLNGADDFITKPIDIQELFLRINSRLRDIEKLNEEGLFCSDLSLNIHTLQVKRQEKVIDLTVKEFELLKHLLLNKNRIMTRERLLKYVWGFSSSVDTRVVDVHVGKLRKKIDDGYENQLIHTFRGFGYKIVGD